MKLKSLSIVTVLAVAVLLALLFGLLSVNRSAASDPAPVARPASVATIPTTVITVTSGTDPDDSQSKTCYTDPAGPAGPPTAPCTLRRAIVEANNLSAGARPILIKFNIPQDPAHGYVAALGIWKIQVYNTTQTVALGRLADGRIIIDGTAQPGGRATGPKIIIVGPGTGQRNGLVVGDVAGDNSNELRGLAFQNFKDHLLVNTDYNVIENNWFGLTDDGNLPYLRGGNPQDGSGSSGVAISAGADHNLIRTNVFLGFDGVSAAIREAANTFSENLVGTTADGRTPGKQTDPSLICTPVDWLAGGGVSVEGQGQVIENNTFAALRQEISATAMQPEAIRASGTGHFIRNNRIGLDGHGNEVGICGRGVYLISSPKTMQVYGNTFVETRLAAISLNDPLYDANTLRGNTIKKTSPWPQVDGSAKPENAIQLNTSLPDAFENFKPAAVTQIAGVTVSGTSGAGSACPNCVIELFLDDNDAIQEALQSLAVITATASGAWTATLPAALAAGQGIRTTSTTAQYNTIAGMSAGTTTGLSDLYAPMLKTYLPAVAKKK
ncbi:MAG: right-handed parallel beta-helix repeat-containing protein [Chloroflexi bacterium]|nr:right-handed parallel beta-helix repeat-containing protein [Chloroflexota bacterium]